MTVMKPMPLLKRSKGTIPRQTVRKSAEQVEIVVDRKREIAGEDIVQILQEAQVPDDDIGATLEVADMNLGAWIGDTLAGFAILSFEGENSVNITHLVADTDLGDDDITDALLDSILDIFGNDFRIIASCKGAYLKMYSDRGFKVKDRFRVEHLP